MERIRLVIFDLDGTLVDAYRAIAGSFNHTMRALGYPGQDNLTIRRAVGWGDENLLRPFIKPKDLPRAIGIYRNHHARSLTRYSRLFPGVTRLLRALKTEGFKLAVASNRPTRFSLLLLGHLGIRKYFDCVLCADACTYGKPHPQILNSIMKKFSLKPQQAMYVGDMTIDAEAGRRARVRTIIITTGSSAASEIKKIKPYRTIRNISALSKILLPETGTQASLS